jgi:hypothetical protein
MEGVAYIFGRITMKSLMILTLKELNTIFEMVHQKPSEYLQRREVATRIKDFISDLAIDQEHANLPKLRKRIMATDKTKKSAPKKKGAAKKKSAGAGRPNPHVGKKLIKTEKGENARRNAGSRRTQSWEAVKSGVKYETAINAGAHADDLAHLIAVGHLKTE